MEMFDKISDILKMLSGAQEICSTDSLLEDLALDSLNMVTLLLELEDAFQIELKESDLNPYELTTVSDIERMIQTYIDKKQ